MVLMMIAVSPPAYADQGQSSPSPVQNGSRKIWTGVALIAAGAVAMPITGVAYVSQARKATGATLIGLGTGFLIWEARDRQRAQPRPSVQVGVSVGRSNSVVFQRRW